MYICSYDVVFAYTFYLPTVAFLSELEGPVCSRFDE